MIPTSIRGRISLAAGVLTLLALGFSWMVLSALLDGFVTRRLTAELAAHASGIIASAEWEEEGEVFRSPPLADPRFGQPLSGFYWQVDDGESILARSLSLLSQNLATEPGSGAASLPLVGPHGEPMLAVRERFTAPGDDRQLFVTVTMPDRDRVRELAAVRAPLAWSLFTLGLALVIAQWTIVKTGLSELTLFSKALAQVGTGKLASLPTPRAEELKPLAVQMNRLLSANAAVLQRARAVAGDLAHGLKTPLAVLANRLKLEDAHLIERMERMIQWHLKRARASGTHVSSHVATPVNTVLEDIGLVFRPSAERRGIVLEIRVEGMASFQGDCEDLTEMVANLAENAVAWAKSRVSITARPSSGQLWVEVCDDGPGIPADQRGHLLRRGARLDESMPGHGLGLAIVADRVQLYGGEFELAGAPGGGVPARLKLPLA